MTLRTVLLAILTSFGLALLASLASQGWSAYADFSSAQRARAVDQTRQEMLLATIALRDDRLAEAFAAAGLDEYADAPPDRFPLDSALEHLDAALALLPAAKLGDHDHYVTELIREHETLTALRGAADSRVDHAGLSLQLRSSADRIMALRVAMHDEIGIDDVLLAVLHLLRNYTVVVDNRLTENSLRILAQLARPDAPPPPTLAGEIRRIANQTDGMSAGLEEVFSIYRILPVVRTADLARFLNDEYAPAEAALAATLMQQHTTATQAARDAWLEQRLKAEQHARGLLQLLYESTQQRLSVQHDRALGTLRAWLALSGLALGIYLASALAIWLLVVRPLHRIRETMLQLAAGNLARTPTRNELMSDLRLMSDTLRVFRINAVRRERLQRERLALHVRIAEAHAEMRSDLEAAAVVQRSQLPAPGVVGAFRFSALYRPSRMLAGDSYDFMPLPGGGARIFQIDVAGHGAAASLVSVAAHVALKRALEHLPPGGDLAGTLESVNANWSSELTYFTLLLIELDPVAQTGRLVQAGHPYPAILRRDGRLERLGEGGLPVGVLPRGDYSETRFNMAAGDRLLVFSDGLYEATDPDGHIFGEDRLAGLIKAYAGLDTGALIERIDRGLQDWAQSDHMDDDISLVVAERV